MRSRFHLFTVSCVALFAVGAAAMLLISSSAVSADEQVASSAGGNSAKPAKAKKTMLRHVVMFQFKSTSSAADIQKVVDAFRALPTQIPQIAAFEYGENNSPEKLNKGLSHCFL
ncbi:MAG: Dabb family protein, partial [Planctomycetota bacterium]